MSEPAPIPGGLEPPAPESPPTPPAAQPYRWGWRQYLALAAILASVAALRLYVVESDIVEGGSMQPTLQSGDYVLIYKLAYRGGRLPERGAIVTLASPIEPGEILVKRVVGLPGDYVQYVNGWVLINGVTMGRMAAAPGWRDEPPEYVPPGHVYVLGDNRGNSEDSRDWGPISAGALRGRALLVYLPPGRLGVVR